MGIRKVDIEKVAAAIEADAGESLPDLRQALAEAKAGLGRVTTPEQVLVRQAREKSGLTQAAFAARIATPVATCVIGSKGGSRRQAVFCACCG